MTLYNGIETAVKMRDSRANIISYYLLLALVLSLPFDRFYSHIFLIGLLIHTLIGLKKGNIKSVSKIKMIMLQSVFLITVIGTLYAFNIKEAFNDIGKQLAIFLFPLFFWLNPLNIARYRDRLMLAFLLVCTLTVVYLFANALVTLMHYDLPLRYIFSKAFTNHNFSEPIKAHATFFSMQLIIALAVSACKMLKEKSLILKIFFGLSFLILTSGLIQLGSKSMVLVLFICFISSIFLLKIAGGLRIKYILAALIVPCIILIGIFKSDNFRTRYIESFKQDFSISQAPQISDTRLDRWKIAWQLIARSPVVGYGSGSERDLLHPQFFKHHLYSSFVHNLNIHNEYLSLLLKFGIWGLCAFLVTLAYGFSYALKARDMVFFSFMTMIAIVSFSENILDVDKGIFFYGFFLSFFVFANGYMQKPGKARDDKSINPGTTNLQVQA